MDCLRFAIEHGAQPEDFDLDDAVKGGHLACVELLTAHGLPRQPYLQYPSVSRQGPVPIGPGQLRCLQYLCDQGCAIHPGTLICAALRGDLDSLQFLHGRGVPLWEGAAEESGDEDEGPPASLLVYWRPSLKVKQRANWSASKIIALPPNAEAAEHMMNTLHYGWTLGAPLTPLMEDVFKGKRAATRAVLLCFHVAAQLARQERTEEERAVCGGMGRMPLDLIEKVLVFAHLEIKESLRRGLQRGCTVVVQKRASHWNRSPLQDVWVHA